jgi:hypothetical protein
MYDKYERNDSFAGWMIAGGARLDEPDPRHIEHLVALRDASRETHRLVSPLAWLAARFAPRTTVAASAAAPGASTTCCAPA